MSSKSQSGNCIGEGVSLIYVHRMHARIEKMGDGFGLRLPKRLLEASGLGGEVNVTVRDKTLVIAPAHRAAPSSWAEAIQKIPQAELDKDYADLQAFRETPEEWDAHGWQWPEGPNCEKV